MDANEFEFLRRLFDKETLKNRIARSGVFLIAFDFLKSALIRKIKWFITYGGSASTELYVQEVLARDPQKDPLIASARWFQGRGVLTNEDVTLIIRFRDHRNVIAHELPNILFDTKFDGGLEIMFNLYTLLDKVEKWWILEIEVPTDPDFAGTEISPSDISASADTVKLLMRIVYDLED
jgi:hypothetical protein